MMTKQSSHLRLVHPSPPEPPADDREYTIIVDSYPDAPSLWSAAGFTRECRDVMHDANPPSYHAAVLVALG